MSEKDANTALECYANRQAAERAEWAKVLAKPTKIAKSAPKRKTKKNLIAGFFGL